GFGICGSQASGIIEYLADGTWTKRLHAGWAAHAGVVAALLARAGFTGPETVLEGFAGGVGNAALSAVLRGRPRWVGGGAPRPRGLHRARDRARGLRRRVRQGASLRAAREPDAHLGV